MRHPEMQYRQPSVLIELRGRVWWCNTPIFFREIDSWENLLDISLIYWMYHLVYYLS